MKYLLSKAEESHPGFFIFAKKKIMAREGHSVSGTATERVVVQQNSRGSSVLRGFRPQAGQLERIIAERNRRNNNRPLMTYGGRDFTGQGPYDL